MSFVYDYEIWDGDTELLREPLVDASGNPTTIPAGSLVEVFFQRLEPTPDVVFSRTGVYVDTETEVTYTLLTADLKLPAAETKGHVFLAQFVTTTSVGAQQTGPIRRILVKPSLGTAA